MRRYVVTNRCSGKQNESERRASRAIFDAAFESLLSAKGRVIGDNNPKEAQRRRVIIFEAEPHEIEGIAEKLPNDMILEEEILRDVLGHDRRPEAHSPLPSVAVDLETEDGVSFMITVLGSGQPLEGCKVVLILATQPPAPFPEQKHRVAVTTPLGRATLKFSPSFTPVGLIASPPGGFWSEFVPLPESGMTVNVQRLPDGPLGWWHKAVGVGSYDLNRGSGVKVGVIDTGVGPHSFLSHVTNIGSFVDGMSDPGGGADATVHGSHVCGTIGARPTDPLAFGGIAPGVQLFSARVFPYENRPTWGANQADIANALDSLSFDHQVDLINLSFGSESPSAIELDAIREALERGILCFCAAGNRGGRVEYPGAYDETIAVSALGLTGWAPPRTISSLEEPSQNETERLGSSGRFLAGFSCRGPEIGCCAPGVGIISTFPERYGLNTPYAAMDGTSMASPIACGTLAAILSEATEYLDSPRNVSRTLKARALLEGNCWDVGMGEKFQGHGIPMFRHDA